MIVKCDPAAIRTPKHLDVLLTKSGR